MILRVLKKIAHFCLILHRLTEFFRNIKSLYSAQIQEYVDQKKTQYSDTSHAEQSINNRIEFYLYEFKELTQNNQFLY